MYSYSEDKEYYLVSIDDPIATKVLGKGYIWGNKKDALIFASKSIAKSYLKDLNKNSYIKEI